MNETPRADRFFYFLFSLSLPILFEFFVPQDVSMPVLLRRSASPAAGEVKLGALSKFTSPNMYLAELVLSAPCQCLLPGRVFIVELDACRWCKILFRTRQYAAAVLCRYSQGLTYA